MKEIRKDIPTSIILFGGTGDLAMNMLFPSLIDLYTHSSLPSHITVYVYAHTDIDTETMRGRIREKLANEHSPKILEHFLQHVHYIRGSFNTGEDYKKLLTIIEEHDEGICSNKLFYLSVPPRFFEDVFSGLRSVGLHEHCNKEFGWTRLVVEKPFGDSLNSAQKLEKILHTTFAAEQVFHVDHYLCKDMVRNMISFRFSNTIFEPLWNKEYVEKIIIKMHESKDVDTRGAFYDQVGAFRDVGQNHMLEMLAFVAMERPQSLLPEDIQQARAEVIRNMSMENPKFVRAQYNGYQDTDGVDPDSSTETYFHIEASINNDRWQDVPIELSAGKGLAETRASMQIIFKDSPCLCVNTDKNHSHENILTFSLKPTEEITLGTWTKVPGIEDHLQERILKLPYADVTDGVVRGAYSKVFHDVIAGDQTLFTSQDEIYAGWEFSDVVLEKLEQADLVRYDRGTTPA